MRVAVLVRALVVGVSLIAQTGAVSCRSSIETAPLIVQPGAPGRTSQVVSAEQASAAAGVSATAADVAFMQAMITHHAQALEMVRLLSSRTEREDLRMLGLRIELSQSDEIRMMERWLQAQGQPLPGPHAHHGPGDAMPGMLTIEEMAALSAAKGAEFDRLFLAGMIKHHEGALAMVKTLFATPGAAQEPEIFAFASDVDADQRMEIDRMRPMLNSLGTNGPDGVLERPTNDR